MKTLLDTIQGSEIWLTTDYETGQEIVEFTADLDVDCDGSGGNPHGDPFFQPDTRLHFQGKPLHAETVPYVVVPPVVLRRTRGKVLGSSCEVFNLENGKTSLAVVGDSGPSRKIGEGSPALCDDLGLDNNPNHGGTDRKIIKMRIYVGRPALVRSVLYDLQSA